MVGGWEGGKEGICHPTMLPYRISLYMPPIPPWVHLPCTSASPGATSALVGVYPGKTLGSRKGITHGQALSFRINN